MKNRREKLKKIFKDCGFILKSSSKEKAKADEYEAASNQYSTIYFYWNQDKDAVNLAIDPRLPYADLINIEGVSLKKTPQSNGLRFGTTMKKFPFEFNGIRPNDPQSRVGRMFAVDEPMLPIFLKNIFLNLKNDSLPELKEDDGQNDLTLNNDSVRNKIPTESIPDDILYNMQLASNKIESEYNNRPGEDVDAIVKRRVGQSEFRSLLESKHGSFCHISHINNRRLLIASHIVPWSKSTGAEKTDPDNGLLLAVNWDAVFDKGLISFDDCGKVIFSDELDQEVSDRLGLDRNVTLNEDILTSGRKKYLQRHREQIFEYWKKVS